MTQNKRFHLDEYNELSHLYYDSQTKRMIARKASRHHSVLNPGDKIPINGYLFFEELDISRLEEYKDHRRMINFYHNGMKCSNPSCSCEGSRLIKGKDRSGGIHIDIYTSSLIMMTVDHIIPLSGGGTWDVKNLQPMCTFCNSKKARKSNADFMSSNYNPRKVLYGSNNQSFPIV